MRQAAKCSLTEQFAKAGETPIFNGHVIRQKTHVMTVIMRGRAQQCKQLIKYKRFIEFSCSLLISRSS